MCGTLLVRLLPQSAGRSPSIDPAQPNTACAAACMQKSDTWWQKWERIFILWSMRIARANWTGKKCNRSIKMSDLLYSLTQLPACKKNDTGCHQWQEVVIFKTLILYIQIQFVHNITDFHIPTMSRHNPTLSACKKWHFVKDVVDGGNYLSLHQNWMETILFICLFKLVRPLSILWAHWNLACTVHASDSDINDSGNAGGHFELGKFWGKKWY